MEKRNKYARNAFVIFAWLFVVCVVVQVFIAGLATFLNPANWSLHTNFVHIFELVPIIMCVLALIGKLPRTFVWQSLGLLGLIILQYATAKLGNAWILPALHPVLALAIFWWSISIANRVRRSSRA